MPENNSALSLELKFLQQDGIREDVVNVRRITDIRD